MFRNACILLMCATYFASAIEILGPGIEPEDIRIKEKYPLTVQLQFDTNNSVLNDKIQKQFLHLPFMSMGVRSYAEWMSIQEYLISMFQDFMKCENRSLTFGKADPIGDRKDIEIEKVIFSPDVTRIFDDATEKWWVPLPNEILQFRFPKHYLSATGGDNPPTNARKDILWYIRSAVFEGYSRDELDIKITSMRVKFYLPPNTKRPIMPDGVNFNDPILTIMADEADRVRVYDATPSVTQDP